jgi:hypothetical protein
MSAGKFKLGAKYESDNGSIYSIRIQPETATTVNVAPTAAVTAGVGSVRVGGGKNQIGIRARFISGRWKESGGDDDTAATPDAPDGYDSGGIIRVPILTASVFATLNKGTDFAYLGKTLVITSTTAENVV